MFKSRIFNLKFISILFFSIFCAGFLFVLNSNTAQAEHLLFFEEGTGVNSGSNDFSIEVKINTSGNTVNAIQSTIHFSPEFLEVISISKKNSVFKLWPEEPIFSNSQGTISFSAGIPSPGFIGIGKVFAVNFRAKSKKTGEAKIFFDEAQVLSADGRGTELANSSGGSVGSNNDSLAEDDNPGIVKIAIASGNVEISLPEISVEEDFSEEKYFGGGQQFSGAYNPEAEKMPPLPEISSDTHPEQDRWYKESDAFFRWNLSADIIGASYKLDQKKSVIPDFVSEGLTGSKKIEGIKNGIWYFHLKLQNQYGWSRTSNFKIQIDADSPEAFIVTINNQNDPTSPQPSASFEAKDILSGINRYEIKIDEGNIVSLEYGKASPFLMPLQMPGKHKISVLAIDNAGNKAESTADFEIKPIASPEIFIYPESYNAGEEILYLEGAAAPSSVITIYFEENGRQIKNFQTFSDKSGVWSFSTNELLKDGVYKIFAKAKDSRGAVSDFSEPQSVKVVLKGILLGNSLASYRQLLSAVAFIIILLLLVTIYTYLKMLRDKRKLEKEIKEAKLSLKNTFEALKRNLFQKIEYFDSKPGLNPKEKEVLDYIIETLNKSEQIVSKEINDIEKEMK